MGYVYILKNLAGGYYIGSTNNLDKRLKQHLSGHTYSTKRMSGLELVFSQSLDSLKVARRIEAKLKKLKRKDYIDKIIKEGYIRILPA